MTSPQTPPNAGSLAASYPSIDALLRRRFGLDAFRGNQRSIVERTLSGGHSLVLMPTGGGKSLCFQVPALALHEIGTRTDRPSDSSGSSELSASSSSRTPITLVLSPLVALMKDQVDGLQRKGIDVAMVNSLLDRETRLLRYDEIANGRYCMLYVTPERFRKPDFLEALSRREVVLLAVDEAHCISEWGHDFRPDYSRLCEIRQLLGNPTTIALTATATPDVQQDILRQLGLPAFGNSMDECKLFHSGIERPNLELQVEEVWGTDEKQTHIEAMVARWPRQSGIVYFTLIRNLEEMSDRLRRAGVEHVSYHGDLPRQRRNEIQNRFMRGSIPLVLATNAFGMGIDKEDIRYVMHAEVPGSLESYYQEIGRAGRDGKPSVCLFLYNQEDLLTQMEFNRWSNPDADFYFRVYDFLCHETERVRAFGIDWLRERLCHRHKQDRRLETALSMLYRYGIIPDEYDLSELTVDGELPASLSDELTRNEKMQRDQRKLYALVQYTKAEDRKQFLYDYFQPQPDSTPTT